ncbi:MAG: ABC transporter substrate-binding protein [Ruminiclostridium sp.]|nr:ABC transporter substrate-binding protein [Ruminiclostridium sp.]
MKKFLLLFSACILLCSCNIQLKTPEETEETLPVAATTELTEEPEPLPQPYPVTVNDVVIENSPQRVVSLSPSLTEIIFEMGYGDRIVGRGSYCDYPEAATDITDVGRPSKPDLDAVIALKPDVLFTATSIPLKDLYRLEENGIKTIFLSYPVSVEEFGRIYSALGLIFEGKFDGEAAGEKIFEPIEKAISEGKADLGSFVYITEGLTVATGDTFESDLLSAYGTNIGAEGKNYAYPSEYLVQFQPDIVLLNDNYTIDDLLAHEVYSQLTAVVNGDVYCISNTYFERPSGRITELISELSEIGS